MKESRKAKAQEFRNRLEEMNVLKANEEFIIDCINDEDVAKIVISEHESIGIKLSTLDFVEDEEDWIEVIDRTKASIRHARSIAREFHVIAEKFDSYAATKDIIIVRPLHIDAEFYGKYEDMPFMYRPIADIALVVYGIVADKDGILNTVKLPMELIEKWEKENEIDEDDVFEQAMRNTEERYKAALYTNIFDIENTPILDCMLMENGYRVTELTDNTVALITTMKKTNGAIAMWYSGVKEKISELYGGSSFYAAFTSIHEAMIHKAGTISIDSIRRNVTETNRIFGPHDTLSDKVWYYNAEDGSFTAI